MDSNRDWQISKTSLSERFKELYKLNEWTDCAFSVGDVDVELIKCHKLVLAASSPVFEALFYGPLADYEKVIHVPDLQPQTFKSLLRYIYCDKVELSTILDAGMLLYASKKYLLPHLSRKCLDYMVQHMHITNLWDALDVAESLNEEELLDTCLKVMRQYSIGVWSSSGDHLSKLVLCRLLDQDPSNISETELWTFVISWAEMECQLKNLEPTPENIRSIIDDVGLLKKIRFLTFTKKDLYELVKPSGVISTNELEALNKCIESINNNRNDNSCDNSISSNSCNVNNAHNFVVPDGFNTNKSKRLRILAYINHCPRKILTKRKTWIYGGNTVCTKVTSQTHVLVMGFEVFTRIPSTADFCMSPGYTVHYNEQMTVKISDDEDVELGTTYYTGIAEFNASQNIKLSQPILFYPHRKYTVTFKLHEGQYPLNQLSSVATCKIAIFRFEDFANDYSEGSPDYSFISAVMCSL